MQSRTQFADVSERVVGSPLYDWQREVGEERPAPAGKR